MAVKVNEEPAFSAIEVADVANVTVGAFSFSIIVIVTLMAFVLPKVIEQAKKEQRIRVGENFNYKPLLGDRNPPLDYRKVN